MAYTTDICPTTSALQRSESPVRQHLALYEGRIFTQHPLGHILPVFKNRSIVFMFQWIHYAAILYCRFLYIFVLNKF